MISCQTNGRGAILGVKLGEQMLDMLADRLGGDAEDLCDVGVPFAMGNPAEDFALPRGEAVAA
jgi:hypothetical protein